MGPSLRLLVLALAAGCGGATMKTVPVARYQAVPADARARIETARAAELAAAQADVARATRELAVARTAAQHAVAIRAPASGRDARAAVVRVDAARTAWLAAGVTWRARRLEAAQLHVVAIECARELERAEAIDQRSDDLDDVYDTSAFRAQHGRAEEAWYVAEARAADTRRALDQGAAALTDAKQAYAAASARELAAAQLAAIATVPPTPHMMW